MNGWQIGEDRLKGNKEAVKNLLEFVEEGDRILDIGCGDGSIGSILTEEIDCVYEGYDIQSDAEIRLEKKGFKFNPKLENIDNKYDLIMLIDVIEHLDINKINFIHSQIIRLLKKGGRLLIKTPNADRCMFLMDHFYNNPEHLRPFPHESIRVLFYENFEIEKVKYFGNFKHPLKIILNLILYRRTPKECALYSLKKDIKPILLNNLNQVVKSKKHLI